MGITDGLIRYAVGVEDTADIVADVEQALERLEIGKQYLKDSHAVCVATMLGVRAPMMHAQCHAHFPPRPCLLCPSIARRIGSSKNEGAGTSGVGNARHHQRLLGKHS